MIGEMYKTLCQAEAGFIVLPMGDGSYFVGDCLPMSIEGRQETADAYGPTGELQCFAAGPPEVTATVRCIGQLVVMDEKPTLTDNASILELMRVVNDKMKKREDQTTETP